MAVGTIKKDERQILKELRGFSEDTDWISEKQTQHPISVIFSYHLIGKYIRCT